MQDLFMRLAEESYYTFGFVISISMSFAVGCLFSFHLYLLMNNYSTIEMDVLIRRNMYNIGKIENLKQVLGRNPFFWFLPTKPDRISNGILYPNLQNLNPTFEEY